MAGNSANPNETETHTKKVDRHPALSDGHKALLRLFGKGVVTAEHVGRRAVAAEKDAERAIRQAERKARLASARPTSAVKRAMSFSGKQLSNAKGLFGSLTRSLRHEGRALKRAVRMAEVEREKETAKQKAVAEFVSKWELDYEQNLKGNPAPTGLKNDTHPRTEH